MVPPPVREVQRLFGPYRARMRAGVAVVRGWELAHHEGHDAPLNAASLVKQVIAHVALEVLDDLDEPVHHAITVRHILSHTTGLPNWRPPGKPLAPLRPPGTRWGYSGEGFVLLLGHLERHTGQTIDDLTGQLVFSRFGMVDSRLDEPEELFHGNRPLLTTAADYGRFLAGVLAVDDARWRPQTTIDDELAWGLGWGLEIGPPVHAWQWGSNVDTSSFVIGCPSTGDGVVVLTDVADGRALYASVVARELPGDHPSLRVEHNRTWLELLLG
jgi:CubicO group peptidase (beta-lactamase class C family)